MSDMSRDFFARTTFGKLALEKMAAKEPLPDNFRLFEAGYIEDKPEDFNTMKVVGAQFRHAKTGPNKGQLSIKVPDTERSACVTRDEIRGAE